VIETDSLATSVIELPHGANGIRGMSISPDGQYALVTHVLSNFESLPFRVDTGWINVNVVSVIDLSGARGSPRSGWTITIAEPEILGMCSGRRTARCCTSAWPGRTNWP
jgi:hypothetical protein